MSERMYSSNRKTSAFKAEQIDTIHRRLWIVQTSCFVISAVLLLGTLIAASIHVKDGFPCFFAAVVDYKTVNDTAIKLGMATPRLGGVVPVLFFETHEVTFFFYAVSIIMLFIAFYMIVGAVIVNKNQDASYTVDRGTAYMTSLISGPSTILMGTITIWLLQATLVILSYKLIVLAAVIYMVHFTIFTAFFGYFCGRGVDSVTYADEVYSSKQIGSTFHRLVGNCRAFIVNIIGGVYGTSLIMVCLMFGLLLANSFTTTFWHIIVITLITTSVLTLIYLLVLELLVARYVHMLLGPYIGLLVGYGMLGTTAADYTARFYYAMGGSGADLRLGCQIVLGIVAGIIVIAAILRIIRASIYHKKRFTRAYNRAEKIRGVITNRASRMVQYVNRSRGDRRGDTVPLRKAAPVSSDSSSISSDGEEVIYDNMDVDTTDSEWET